MKRKIVSVMLCASMVATMLAGCGSTPAADGAADTAETEATADSASDTDAAEAEAEDEGPKQTEAGAAAVANAGEGNVFNIACWNEEFKSRVTDHYPGYEEIDATTGKIGDVVVNWLITPNKDNAYQTDLDSRLLAQADAAVNDKVDMFLVEADYALKYTDTDFVLPVSEFGITDADVANQYQYTKDIVTDSQGVLKGVSWQGCPAVMFYNRAAATEVLGSDDAETVQAAVKDWATFNETAKKFQEAGYYMTSTTNDTYRIYSNNVSSKWVEDGKLNIDENIMNWVNDSKALVDAKATKTNDLWSDEWSQGFYPEGKVFAYFGPAWLINFSMAADKEGSIGFDGGWGACVGPQSFYWGGTWICGAAGTDNGDIVGDIMKQLTCNEEIMTSIVKADDDFVNNKPAMEAMAKDETYTSKILGGINPLQMYCDGAESVDLSNLSSYDQGCNEEFQNAMKNYFEGNATLDEALDLFKKAVAEKYPDITVE